MTGVIHSLSASITSALAVKPSTVYVLRIENTQTHDVWHLRRCFSEFCDLRERMLVLIDGGSLTGTATPAGGGSSAQNSPTTTTTPTAAMTTMTLTAMRLLALNPSLRGGGSAPGSNTNSPRSAGSAAAAGGGAAQERYPYLYTKFPRRQFFGSRSKKVIEQRTLALNQFLQEALWFMREARTQHNIAMYFSLMTQLEVFFDCAKHAAKSSANAPPTASTGLCPAFYTAANKVKHATPPQRAPVVPFAMVATTNHTSPELGESAAKHAADRARAVAARGFWHAPANNDHHDDRDEEDDESDEEADDYEERKVLKRPISCFLHHEVRERRVSNPASQFVAALQSRASERDAVISAADAWAARIEIAGIAPAEALRRRNSNNQAMLIKQYSSPMLSTTKVSDHHLWPEAVRAPTTAASYGINGRAPAARRA